MNVSTGTMNEDAILEALSHKKVKDLSNNMKEMMTRLFGLLDPEETVKCEKTCEFVKPDILVTYKGRTRGISIKSENSEIVHCEQVETFVKKLESLCFSNRTIETILFFQFGDGTMDGSGSTRLNYTEIKYRLQKRIEEANEDLIHSYDAIVALVNYCLFDGVRDDAEKADAIYIGDVNYGYVATKEQVRRFLTGKTWNHYENLHIGPLLMRPHARYVNRNVKSEHGRHQIDIYWPRLFHEISYISRRYNYYDTPYKSWRDKHS